LFLGLLVAELALVLGPANVQLSGHPDGSRPYTSGWLLSTFFPNRIPHQHVLYLHQLFLSVSIAISRIVPALYPLPPDSSKLRADVMGPMAARLSELAHGVQNESSRMMVSELRVLHVASGTVGRDEEFTPHSLNDGILARLRTGLEELIVDRSLRSHPPVRTVWDAAVKRAKTQENDDADEVDAQEELERDDTESDAKTQIGILSPPGSEQPESPRVREENEREETERQEKMRSAAAVAGLFKPRAPSSILQSQLGLSFPGTPGARVRRGSM